MYSNKRTSGMRTVFFFLRWTSRRSADFCNFPTTRASVGRGARWRWMLVMVDGAGVTRACVWTTFLFRGAARSWLGASKYFKINVLFMERAHKCVCVCMCEYRPHHALGADASPTRAHPPTSHICAPNKRTHTVDIHHMARIYVYYNICNWGIVWLKDDFLQ